MSLSTEPNHAAASGPFGCLVRELRHERGWSLRDLGDRIVFHRGYIGKIEKGEKFPERRFAELADQALEAKGALIAAWQAEANERQQAEKLGRLLTASVKDSLRLISCEDERLTFDDVDNRVRDLAVAYLAQPPGPMLQDAVELRSEVLRRLRKHDYRAHQIEELYLALGRLQGVLAYAALDLGDGRVAMAHAEAALTCADRADDNELRAWVHGTQSLIFRFQGQYERALASAYDGLNHPTSGTGRLRLLCGVAQSRANLADPEGTNSALDQAQVERDELHTADSVGGLFEFSAAKQHYYAGSSLIWLDGDAHATRAVREAATAITMWEQSPPCERSLDDEALARVYQGTAYLQLRDLDAATAAIRPILDLPTERQISWIRKRLGRTAGMLCEKPYSGSAVAEELYDEISSLAA